MSKHIKHNSSGRFTLSVRALAMAVAVMATAPTWTNAAEPAKSEMMPMPSEQMDHSKMDGMKKMGGTSKTGDVDYDFAANMRMHHQMAVKMAQAEFKNGKNPEMLGMAKDIIAAQEKEIVVFDQWIKANKKPSP
ncbi:DUF305 domain-containing protein [Pseudomonas sp. 10C3]|uniref:DUF305 domain-containing protein n=1 Tax=Pseudomonas sp. 10C3 TaxID=3118753 RepID=UPI002E801EDE|nr:DUF305 domain-containing protein [Pseudomonas sp. 10C3]MEE3507626.1 DUF305 domain-containing protein [Pseudomonas sp. 10C3]